MKEKGIISILEDKQIYEPSDGVKLKACIKFRRSLLIKGKDRPKKEGFKDKGLLI